MPAPDILAITPPRPATTPPRPATTPPRPATTPPRPATTPLAAPKRPALAGVATGTGAMVCVGGSVAVSGVLAHAPVFTAEALRYAMACVILLILARLTGRQLVLPHGIEWLWLAGIAATGLVLFNVALVAGSRHAEPAVLGVAVACVPAVLAVIGPLLEGSRPRAAGVTAALVVTCGAALVQGLGRTDGLGVAWAAVVFACEAAFTLLAIPVLGRHGPWGVSVHTTWIAAVVFAVIGLVHEGPGAAARLSTRDWLAVVYLAVAVTAVAFVMWYSSVGRLGASRAGLLTGVAPVAAAAAGVLLGAPAPRPLVWAGIAVVAAGLTLGLRGASGSRGGPRLLRRIPIHPESAAPGLSLITPFAHRAAARPDLVDGAVVPARAGTTSHRHGAGTPGPG
jgi:drug/metabolite transporter (DMT)-like permease